MLSLNCKEAGSPDCSHTITGATEEEIFANAKKHVIESHGMTPEQFDEEAKNNGEKYRKLIKEV